MTPLEYAATIAYSSKEVLEFSYTMGRKYRDIPNTCMVEAGVAAGAQIIALMWGSNHKVPIYAIDSFAGICLPSNRDDQYPGIKFLTKEEQDLLPDPGKQVLESSGATVVSEADFWHHIDTAFGPKKHNVKTVKGWFEETLPDFECPPISVLRLDSDLYHSTHTALKYLYPKLMDGGVCIIDDYALKGCRDAVHDYIIEKHLVFKPHFIEGKESTLYYWYK